MHLSEIGLHKNFRNSTKMIDDYTASLIERTKEKRFAEQKIKDKKLQEFFTKNAQRSQEIKERKAELKKEAEECDRRRRESKQRAKERKALIEKQQKLKEMGLQNISASKRRILEDKGILPKK